MSTATASGPGPSAPPRATGRWWSSRLAKGAAFALGAALLECLPVAAALQFAAALVAGDPGDAALPLWALLSLVLAGALLGRWLRGQGTATLLLAMAPCWAASAALAVRLSPGGYAGVEDWLGALSHDLLTGGTRLTGTLGLAVLTGYLWWRGLRLGQVPPHSERLAATFKYGLSTVILAIIVTVGVPGTAGGLLIGRLGLLLPLEVFCGLACLAVAQAVAQRDGAMPSAPAPWLGFALLLSGLAVALAFAVTLVLSFDRLSAAVASLGPVGAALDAGLRWLVYGVSYAIFFIFGGVVNWVYQLGRRGALLRPPAAPTTTNPHGCSTAACLPNLPPAQGIVVAILLAVVIAAVLAALIFVIYRSLSALRRPVAEDDDAWERRDALDVRALLGAQLRGLLAGLIPHPAPAALLPEGSVRRLYQDVLAAAERAGSGRQPAETPEEYAPRLAARAHAADAPPDTAVQDARALTAAYERVRYGNAPEADEDHAALRAAARRLIARLRQR